MYKQHLEVSAKYAGFLQKSGMYEALMNNYETFMEQQNYPFVLKEKRIMRLAVWKGICDYYASQGFDKKITLDKLIEETEKVAEKLWGEKEKRIGTKITEEFSETLKEKIEETKTKPEETKTKPKKHAKRTKDNKGNNNKHKSSKGRKVHPGW